jgi:hypothetical protein
VFCVRLRLFGNGLLLFGYGSLVIVNVAPRCMGTWGNGVDVGHVGLESDIRQGFEDMYFFRG